MASVYDNKIIIPIHTYVVLRIINRGYWLSRAILQLMKYMYRYIT